MMQILFSATAWNIFGLVLTLIGVYILYKFAVPFRVQADPRTVTWVSDIPIPQVEQENRRYDRLGFRGLILIINGIACQMAGAVCQILGSWLGN